MSDYVSVMDYLKAIAAVDDWDLDDDDSEVDFTDDDEGDCDD